MTEAEAKMFSVSAGTSVSLGKKSVSDPILVQTYCLGKIFLACHIFSLLFFSQLL
jgi:hypothetical protein